MKKLFTAALLSVLFLLVLHANAQVNYNLVCVDSVWYDSTSAFINVRIFNGDTAQMNYPSVQIVSPPPANDTIGNPSNFVNWFAHLQNTYQVYTDTITQPGILDFSSYTFLIHEGFGVTTAVINWCGPVSTEELSPDELKIFPNPVMEKLYIISYTLNDIESIEIYDLLGNLISSRKQKASGRQQLEFDISDLHSGIYFIRVMDGRNILRAKFMKQ